MCEIESDEMEVYKHKRFRKDNITGIKKLSVSLNSRNSEGYIVKRYIVNFKEKNVWKSKSFYFGKNKNIEDAFFSACFFMIDKQMITENIEECKTIFIDFEHLSRFFVNL